MQWTFSNALLLGMYVIIIDRLICVLNPLQYRARLPRKQITLMLLGSVFISAVQGLCISAFGETSNILMKSFFLYWFGLNIMFIILSTLTYSIAYYSMRKSRKDVHQQPTGQEKKLKKHFFVPGIIIGTYCIFYSIPFTVHFRALMTGPYIIADDLDRKTTMISGCLGLLADPLAYIFLCKRYRKAFFKRMQKWFPCNNNAQNAETTDAIEMNNI